MRQREKGRDGDREDGRGKCGREKKKERKTNLENRGKVERIEYQWKRRQCTYVIE